MPTIVSYDKTNIGKIYLGDVGQRNQLGTGRGIFSHGQDRYIHHGQDATFVTTGDVMMSTAVGRIRYGIDSSAFTIDMTTVP
jgi:transketolase C-terminal domain/subunit